LESIIKNNYQNLKKHIFIYTNNKQKVMAKLDETQQILEERKIKALEKIANSLDALTIWFEEIDKDAWGPRIEHYLYEWHKKYIDTK
jgi:DNA-binding transcriptional regulator YhcF (GntR family)